MEKIAIINDLYYEQKKSLTEIAEIINTSISYVSKILRKDKKYKIEKEKRKQDKLLHRKQVQKKMIYDKRKDNNITKDIDYIDLKRKHEEAAMELSQHSTIGNQALRKWCSGAYKYNENKNRYEFDTQNLLKPADFPLYIKA